MPEVVLYVFTAIGLCTLVALAFCRPKPNSVYWNILYPERCLCGRDRRYPGGYTTDCPECRVELEREQS